MKIRKGIATIVALCALLLIGEGATPSRALGKTSPLLVPLSALTGGEKPDRTLAGATNDVTCLAYSPDGRLLAAGDDDKRVTVWNDATGERVLTLKDLPDKPVSLSFNADGRLLAVGVKDKTIPVFEVATGTRFRLLTGQTDDVRGVAFSPTDPDLLASVGDDRNAILWRVATGTILKSLTGHTDDVCAVAFSPDGRIVATAGKDRGIFLWDAATGAPLRTIGRFDKKVIRLAFSPDGATLAAATDDKSIVLLDVAAGTRLYSVATKDDILGITFSRDGKVLAAAIKDKLISFRESATGTEILALRGLADDPLAMAVSPDGREIASGGKEKTVAIRQTMGLIRLLAASASAARGASAKIAQLETERTDRLLTLNGAKGEFETTREYERRMRRVRQETARINRDYDRRIAALKEAAETREDALKRELYPYALPATLGLYDADRGVFQATVSGRSVAVPVPLDRARALDARKEGLRVEGALRFHSALQAELVNASLVDPATGARYPFGIRVTGTTGATPLPAGKRVEALPRLAIDAITLVEPSGNGMLDAGETGGIRVTVRNRGKGPARGVTLSLVAVAGKPLPSGVEFARETAIGDLGPGEQTTREIGIAAGEETPAAGVELKATALEAEGFDSPPIALAFRVKAFAAPKLEVVRVEVVDTDGHRYVTKGREATVTLTVRNAGAGPARGVVAAIESTSDQVRLFSDPESTIGTLPAGTSRRVSFTLAVTQRYEGGRVLPLSFTIREERERFTVHPAVRLALDEEPVPLRVVEVEGSDTPFPAAGEDINLPPAIPPDRRVIGPHDVAVVIGIERYQNVPKSDYSYNDARTVKGYLNALGFADRNIEFLADERATLSAIRKTIEAWLPNRVRRGHKVFVYFSGHGAPDPATGEAYIVPYDGDPGYLADTGYPLKRLYEYLGRLKGVQVMVVLDSCFSGAGGRSILATGARPLVVTAERQVVPRNTEILASTEGNQISTSYAEKEHGVFTYYFLKAIRDGHRSAADIYRYLRPLVEDEAKRQNVNQTPAILPVPAAGAQTFTLLR